MLNPSFQFAPLNIENVLHPPGSTRASLHLHPSRAMIAVIRGRPQACHRCRGRHTMLVVGWCHMSVTCWHMPAGARRTPPCAVAGTAFQLWTWPFPQATRPSLGMSLLAHKHSLMLKPFGLYCEGYQSSKRGCLCASQAVGAAHIRGHGEADVVANGSCRALGCILASFAAHASGCAPRDILQPDAAGWIRGRPPLGRILTLPGCRAPAARAARPRPGVGSAGPAQAAPS